MGTPYKTLEEQNSHDREKAIRDDIDTDIKSLTNYEYHHLQCLLLIAERIDLVMDAIKRRGEL